MQNPTKFIARNLWATSVLAFIVLFAPLMLREWVSLRAEGLYNVQWHTTSMAKLLERDLGGEFNLSEVLSELASPQTFRYFDEHVRQKLGHLGLLDVKVFDASEEVVYAIDKDLIGKIIPMGKGHQAALAGSIASELTDRDEYVDKSVSDSSENLAEVHVPVKAADGKVAYVLEAYYDYTPIMHRNHLLLIKSAVSLLITTLCVLALLIYLFNSRQKMSKQVEALEAILPICMHCKKIRLERDNQPDEWIEIESYFARQEDLSFSHGLCNDCLQERYPNSRAARNLDPNH